ncbi:MAG: HD domain-containing protein [Chloroflexaceae bacterium]|nr:HD domain-containing protein [Chloroflexaceae bacterium]
MNQPDIRGAIAYALLRLKQDLSPRLCYHSIEHTRDDVVPAVERLAELHHLSDEEVLLLRTAAYYHDIGYIEQRYNHEKVGLQIAGQVLPTFGYRAEQIQVIRGLIMATRMPQSPRNLLEQMMADADLDSLGRDDFFRRSQDLRIELETFEGQCSTSNWYHRQLQFLQQHRYFTESARSLRNPGKEHNMAKLRQLLLVEV